MDREHYEKMKKLQAAVKLIAAECRTHEDCYDGEYECPFFKFDGFGERCKLTGYPGLWEGMADWIDKEEVTE